MNSDGETIDGGAAFNECLNVTSSKLPFFQMIFEYLINLSYFELFVLIRLTIVIRQLLVRIHGEVSNATVMMDYLATARIGFRYFL